MDAKELRIGNYLHDQKDNLCKVESIQKPTRGELEYRAQVIKGGLTRLPNKPILLDEEYHEKHTDYYMLEPTENGMWICVYNGHFEIEFFIHEDQLQFVHQIQNLYFALTGNEIDS